MAAATCACNCGAPIDARAGRRYVDQRHRQRAYRDRVRAAMQARGLPAALSLRAAQIDDPPNLRSGDAPRRRRAAQTRRLTPGQVRISYRKTHDVLIAEFRRVNMADPELRASTVLDPLLTDRQREALRG